MSNNRKIAAVPDDTNQPVPICVVCCGRSGISLLVEDEAANYPHHLITLTKAVAGMHRAIYSARDPSNPNRLPEEDLEHALAGVELVSNMALEFAKLTVGE
jgi:hypothetical protein